MKTRCEMLAEIERLKSDIEDFKHGAKVEADAGDEARAELVIIKDECIDHVNLYKSWTKERESLRKDAERYRWLRDKHHNNRESSMSFCDEHGLIEDMAQVSPDEMNLDAAVDALMGKEG